MALCDNGRKSRRQTEWPELSTQEMHSGGKGGKQGEPFSSWLSDEQVCTLKMHEKLGKWFVNYFQQENVEFEVIAIQLEIPRRQINM